MNRPSRPRGRRAIKAAVAPLLLALSIAVLLWPEISSASEKAAPTPVVQWTLPNGLHVVELRDPGTADVTVQMWYAVGSKNDPDGRSGLAHLFEHLMFGATRDIPSGTFIHKIESMGGTANAMTSDDTTGFYEQAGSAYLEPMLWMEAERMSALSLDAAALATERDVVKEELRGGFLANPYGRLALATAYHSYERHPYRRRTIGALEDLDATTLSQAIAFHNSFYRPDNATLVVVGNFDPAVLRRLVDRYFGPVRHPDTPIPVVSSHEPARTQARDYVEYAPGVPRPAIETTWQIPPASDPRNSGFQILASLLGETASSRLPSALSRNHDMTSEVRASADTKAQGGLFDIRIVMAQGQPTSAAEAVLMDEIDRLRRHPVSGPELERAKALTIAAALRDREDPVGRGTALARSAIVEGGAKDIDRVVGDYESVTSAELQRLAHRYLAPDRRVTITYLSDRDRPPGQPSSTDLATRSATVSTSDIPAHTLAITASPTLPRTMPSAGNAAPPPRPAMSERRMANGLRLIAARTGTVPIATVTLVIRSGARSDNTHLAGLDALTTTLLTRGTVRRDAENFAAAIEQTGGHVEASTAASGSTLTVNVPLGHLGAALSLLSEAAREPALNENEIKLARSHRLDALAVRLSKPREVAKMVVTRLEQGATQVESADSLSAITAADVRDHYAAWFRPNNTVLIIAGGLDPDRALDLAQHRFDMWSGSRLTLPRRPTPASDLAGRTILIDMPGAEQAVAMITTPSIGRADPDFYAAEIANSVLGDTLTGRLFDAIRTRNGLAYRVYSQLDAQQGAGLAYALAETRNETASQVSHLLLQQIHEFEASPPSEAEVSAHRASLEGDRRGWQESSALLSRVLVDYALFDVPVAEAAAFPTLLDRQSTQQVQRAAGRIFSTRQATTFVIGDAKNLTAPLRADYPNIEVMPWDRFNATVASEGGATQ